MKVIYSPEFDGRIFLGLDDERSHIMDSMVCDTNGLVSMLELRLGIHHEDKSAHYRIVEYFRALSEYMNENPDNVLATSFKLSSLGTAEQALVWRDNLVLDKWQAGAVPYSGRVGVLAGTEQFFDCPGLSDRLWKVHSYINNEKDDYFKGLEVELSCDMSLLHPTIIELLEAMKHHGAEISVRTWERDGGSISANAACAENVVGRTIETQDPSHPTKAQDGKNLRKISRLLQSQVNTKISLNKEDRSFLIYAFPDEKAADEYLALKGDTLGADVWINKSNKTFDNWLRMMGKPVMGSRMAEATPQLLQLFVLGIDLMKEPLNIRSLISWLYSPMQPFGSFFGKILAEAIMSEGGYRNNKCKEIVDNFISGKYTYRDKEEDTQLSGEDIAKRNRKEEKARRAIVDTYLPSFEATEKGEISVIRLKVFLNSLTGWARNRFHYLCEKSGNEGWCSQLESLAQMCETFVLLLDYSGAEETIDVKQVDSWISTLYKGESFMLYAPQKGSWELIDNPAKMAFRSKRTIWMNFSGGDTKQLDCNFLYPSEKESLKEYITMWEESNETYYNELMQLMPFLLTDDQLILVITDYQDGEVSPKHPILVRLESQIENLSDFVERPNLNKEQSDIVGLVKNSNTQSSIVFDHANLLRWPEYLSPTSLGTIVEYPFDYLMESMLNIASTGPGSIKDLKTTKGTVAHAVIESLFAPRDGRQCSTADEIEQRIAQEFDAQVAKQIDACGAILYLPENRLDAELLKEQLRKCLDVLLTIIRENGLKVTACEHQVKMDTGMLNSNNGWDMKGYIDMTLEDKEHHPVVFDFKWTSSKNYYRDLLTANRSIQLELYRTMYGAEKKDAVERTAYFLMPEGHLYSKESFKGLHCTQLQPEDNANIVEQLRQSFIYRKEQLGRGVVEVGEGFPLTTLDYYNDTKTKNLFPLKADDNGAQAANSFSDYTLFKQKEDIQ